MTHSGSTEKPNAGKPHGSVDGIGFDGRVGFGAKILATGFSAGRWRYVGRPLCKGETFPKMVEF